MEALSGAPFDVKFISFEDILKEPGSIKEIDVILNVGDADTAQTGGEWWCNPVISSAIKEFVHRGGGFIGVGEPSAHQANGHFFQLANVLGVEEERGFTLGYDKYNKDVHAHFITEDAGAHIDFGEGKKNIYALDGTRSWRRREMTLILPYMNLAQGARSTSAGCRSPLKTADCFTGRFCGAREMKRTSTAGFPPTTMSKSTLMWQTENTAWSTIPMSRRRQRSIPEMAATFRWH